MADVPTPSRARVGIYWVILAAIPVLFFALLEGGLRVGGYGKDLPLFQPLEGYPGTRYQNREASRRYFYFQENPPTPLYDFFRAEKTPETFRLFVMGESSAAGYPFYYGGAFSRMLQQRLQQTFPERDIEVVNTAMAAISSYTLADFAPEILAEQPDAVLIYAGHNEYYGALGVASAESLGRFPWLIDAYLSLQKLRTVQLLRAGIARVMALAPRPNPDGTTLMARMVGEQEIPLDSPLYQAGLRQFERNLTRVVRTFTSAGVPVYVSTVASNERDQPPFISRPAAAFDATAWTARLDRLEALLARDPAQARDSLQIVVGLEDEDARSRYLLGRAWWALGDTASAQLAFLDAKDRDRLRFRAPEAINAKIRAVCSVEGCIVVEGREALAARSPGQSIGAEMMTEHLHPSIEGFFTLADAFYESLRQHEARLSWVRPISREQARSEILVTELDSLVGMLRVRQLVSGWPFQPLGREIPWQNQLNPQTFLDSLSIGLFYNEISWMNANAQLQGYYERRGEPLKALRAALALIQEYPFAFEGYSMAANQLVSLGRLSDALLYANASLERGENAAALSLSGAILLQQEKPSDAIPRLERAVALDARLVQAQYNLAGAYFMANRPDDARRAVQVYRQKFGTHPGIEALAAQLGM